MKGRRGTRGRRFPCSVSSCGCTFLFPACGGKNSREPGGEPLVLEEFARAHAVNGPGIHGQDDGAPQSELVQEIGSSGSVPQAERRKLVQEGGQVFRRVRPGQGQQGGDAESQLEGGFPLPDVPAGMMTPWSWAIWRRPVTRNSRLMMRMVTQTGHSPTPVR